MPTPSVSAAYRISIVLAALLFISSIVGIANGGNGFYASYPASLAGLIGQDVATIAVGLPTLLASAWLARRGSTRAVLVLAGSLFYVAYSYFFFAVGGFNALFPAYLVIVALSVYGLLSLIVSIDPGEIAGQFGDRLPGRLIAAFLIGLALLFAVMWGGMSLSYLVASKIPDAVIRLVVAVDGMVLLPALFIGGWLLLRLAPWGFVLGGLLLVKAVLTGSTLAFTTALGWAWKGSIEGLDAFLLVLFGLMALLGGGLLVRYLRAIRQSADLRGAPAVARAGA